MTAPDFELSDAGNARRLRARYGDRLRFVPEWKRWLVWTGTHWSYDALAQGQVERWAFGTAEAIGYEESKSARSDEENKALKKWSTTSQNRGRVVAMMESARHAPGMEVSLDQLDAIPWLLPCRNGTVDLRTGELRPASRDDLATKVVPVDYDPEARSEAWERFLREVQPDPEVRAYLQRVTGYTATGETSEEVFWVNTGDGGNGKGTFSETIASALGEYATAMRASSLFSRQGSRFDIADIYGARRVDVGEPAKGSRMATDLLKSLTGGDPIRAERKNEPAFVFQPSAKFWVSSNFLPSIPESDNGIWRRLRHVEWPFHTDRPDPRLKRRLREEENLRAVLAWVVQGAVDWYRDGLDEPVAITEARDSYRAEEDVLGQFLEEQTRTTSAENFTPTQRLYDAWVSFCFVSGLDAGDIRQFGRELTARGIESSPGAIRFPGGRGAVRYGIELASGDAVTPEDRAWAEVSR